MCRGAVYMCRGAVYMCRGAVYMCRGGVCILCDTSRGVCTAPGGKNFSQEEHARLQSFQRWSIHVYACMSYIHTYIHMAHAGHHVG
jgi:hypothetical protein